MVVRERTGRKRYILFSHNKSRREILKDMNGIYLAFYSKNYGIVRCRHTQKEKVIQQLRERGYKTLKTSGTIKKLKKYMEEISKSSPGGAM